MEQWHSIMKLSITNIFTAALPGDPLTTNSRRQVHGACYSFVHPKKTKQPNVIHSATKVGELLGLTATDLDSPTFTNVFSGNEILPEMKPYAMCYGGHQFGHWAGQLGDGRAINLGQVNGPKGQHTIQLKGAGETPYSRNADGFAVLRSSVREYLCSEAMYYLGVPTTRALSLALTGDEVMRDILYNGNPANEKGAVVCRVSPSFIRFGNFEILTARNDKDTLKKLVDYTITNYFPEIEPGTKDGYLDFFKSVTERTLNMIIHWQRIGFVHGVMNTDNMSILGLTIDYGPYGWLEGYDYQWTPNTTDREHKRYRYGNQPNIALWNLVQLANALYPLIEEVAPLEQILETYKSSFETRHLEMMRTKLGLMTEQPKDLQLIRQLEENLHLVETDMTLFYRLLANLDKNSETDATNATTLFGSLIDAFYDPTALTAEHLKFWKDWFDNYFSRLQQEPFSNTERREQMNTVNPKYVLRNYMAQLAIEAADKEDYSLIDELYELLKRPYDEQPEMQKWFAKRPEWARHKVGCSMLSCSS